MRKTNALISYISFLRKYGVIISDRAIYMTDCAYEPIVDKKECNGQLYNLKACTS